MSSPQSIRPEIWHTPGFPPLLVCGNRWIHGQELRGAKRWDKETGQVTLNAYELLGHMVALELQTFPARVYFGFTATDPAIKWTVTPPSGKKFPAELGGMTARAAELALTEAWRCVDPYTTHPITYDVKVNYNVKKILTFRDSAIMRNINIWLSWDAWEREGLTEAQRINVITSNGLKCTKKAFRHVLEDAGMSI